MKVSTNPYFFLMIACSLVMANAYAIPTIFPQNKPPVVGYTNPPRTDPNDKFWQVSSVFGPRIPGSKGSKFHKGIDYNQHFDSTLKPPGDADLGVLLTARSAGTIEAINQGIMRIKSKDKGNGNKNYFFDYIHIFDNKIVSNKNTIMAGYSKVELTTLKQKGVKGNCPAVCFFDKQKILVKILTTSNCPNLSIKNTKGNLIEARYDVVADEAIAPIGKHNIGNAHLHLQLNKGADNALTKIIHSTDLINGKTKRFEVKLVQDTFTDQVLGTMTPGKGKTGKGQGFAIEVIENSLVPVLDKITVSDVDKNNVIMKTFSFGGQPAQDPANISVSEPINVSENNILPNLVLEKGWATPAIKPINWSGMGVPRIMTFFVPYKKFATLSNGKHNLSVIITTIDNKKIKVLLIFIKGNPVKKRFIKIANNGKELPESAVLGNKPNDFACLKDIKTGLMWEIKTRDGGIRDGKWRYTWYDPKYLPDINNHTNYIYYRPDDPDGVYAGAENPQKFYAEYLLEPSSNVNLVLCNEKPAHCNTYAYTKMINRKTLCAANNWRIPSSQELFDIGYIFEGVGRFSVDLGIRPYTWSSTNAPLISDIDTDSQAEYWYWLEFGVGDNGFIGRIDKYNSSGIRLVRSVK